MGIVLHAQIAMLWFSAQQYLSFQSHSELSSNFKVEMIFCALWKLQPQAAAGTRRGSGRGSNCTMLAVGPGEPQEQLLLSVLFSTQKLSRRWKAGWCG